MKKFSQLSKSELTVESATNKKDFIQNLIEESLTVVDGAIVGKDILSKTLNKIIEMNDSKTKIAILESVKVSAYRGGFDFNKISEAIEQEKAKLNMPIQQEVVEEEKVDGDIFFAQKNTTIVSMSESLDNTDVEETEEVVEESVETDEEIIEEKKKEKKKEECDDEDCDDEDCDDEDCNDEEEEPVKEGLEEEVVEEVVEEVIEEREDFIDPVVENDSAVTKVKTIVSDYEKEKSDLNSLYEGILQEHHLDTREEKVKFILENIAKVEVEGENKKAAIENMSDKEIDKVYTKLEKDLGIID